MLEIQWLSGGFELFSVLCRSGHVSNTARDLLHAKRH